jgi:hypothetical protein
MNRLPLLAVAGLLARAAAGQAASLIDIEIDNGVFYVYDTADSTKFATVPGIVAPWSSSPGVTSRNFWSGVYIADVVLVNGRPGPRGDGAPRDTNQPGRDCGFRPSHCRCGRKLSGRRRMGVPERGRNRSGPSRTHGFIGGGPPPGAPALAMNTNLAVTGGQGSITERGAR